MTDRTVAIAAAPNGARLTRKDHPAIPISPAEVAACARECLAEGAAMIHVHARAADDTHTLDPGRMAAVRDSVRDAVGDGLVLQLTTEAIGIYEPPAQMELVRATRPEAASFAIRELAPDATNEKPFGDLLGWMRGEGMHAQFILYDLADLRRLIDLRERGVVPWASPSVLVVLGRYVPGGAWSAASLGPYLDPMAAAGITDWMVCAFGREASAASAAALALGGGTRVGLENSTVDADDRQVAGNAALVAHAAGLARAIGRRPLTGPELRARWRALD